MKATRCPICESVFAVDETLNPVVPEGEIVRGRDELGIKAEGVASPRDSTLLQIRTLVQRRARPKNKSTPRSDGQSPIQQGANQTGSFLPHIS